MGLDTATSVGGLDKLSPGATDAVSEGDNHIRKVKEVLVTDFANITGAVTASHTELNYLDITTLGTAEASKAVTIDASSAFTLAGMTCADAGILTTVDIDAGTVDATIGATAPAAGTFTTLTGTVVAASTSLDINSTVVLVGTLDDDTMATATDTTLATSESIKAYADAKRTYTTPVATTSGSTVEVFDGIPSTATKVAVLFKGVGTAAAADMKIQIGSSGSYKTSGYLGSSTHLAANSMATTTFTDSFGLDRGSSTNPVSGMIVLENQTANIWVASGTVGTNGTNAHVTAGYVDLAAAITRVRITTSGTLNAGTISLVYG